MKFNDSVVLINTYKYIDTDTLILAMIDADTVDQYSIIKQSLVAILKGQCIIMTIIYCNYCFEVTSYLLCDDIVSRIKFLRILWMFIIIQKFKLSLKLFLL